MKAFAVTTIQRGKSADPRVINAGEVFDATDAELLHLTPMGAVRKPTKDELAIENWKKAEAEDEQNGGAKALVAAVFGDAPAPVPAASAPAAEVVEEKKPDESGEDLDV